MAISPYVRKLRAQVGSARLLLPSVSVHIFDAEARLLLVRQADSGLWSTPGGLIEPDEIPADAAAREAWEETGLTVRVDQLLAVYGGPECVVHYPNGDQTQYVIVAFGCVPESGELRPDHDETAEVRYWSRSEAETLPLAPWLRALLPLVYGAPGAASFQPPSWKPPNTERNFDEQGPLPRTTRSSLRTRGYRWCNTCVCSSISPPPLAHTMTDLLRKAFEAAAQLPEEEQKALAVAILAEVASEDEWDSRFTTSAEALARLADEALGEHKRARTKPLDPDEL